MSHRKHKIIRKTKSSQPKPQQQNSISHNNVSTQTNVETTNQIIKLCLQLQENEDLSEFKTIKPLHLPIKQVALLQPQQRLRLKQNHSHIAEYIFMSQRQKCKYFHEKNLKYNLKMQTPGNLPARKISFKRNFQVRSFTKQQAASNVKTAKSFRDKYNQKIHYS